MPVNDAERQKWMGKVQLSLSLEFSDLLGAQVNSYPLRVLEIRFALERSSICHHPASTDCVLDAVLEVGNAKVTHVRPLSPTGSQERAN